MSRTAVVILNYNGREFLRQFLPSVVQHSGDADIIVADNGSSDDSLAVIADEFPQVRVIRLEKNFGFCGGYNRALKHVSADYYVLLNSDVQVTAHWITPMKALLDSQQDVAAVQPKILSFLNPEFFEYAGAGGGFIDELGYPFCRGRLFSSVEKDSYQYDDTRPVFWASGACMMIRSEVYHQFGGLDEDFFAHMEEIDLCWRIQRAGLKIYYCGRSVVYHQGAGTLGYTHPGKTYLNFRNGLSMITKHFTVGEIWWKIPLRLSLDWVAGATFIFQGNWPHCASVLRAHRDYFAHMRNILRKRKEIQKRYPSYPRDTIYRGSALVQAFLKRKNKINVV